MTKEETKEAIKIMQAYVDGELIEFYDKIHERWSETNAPMWNCHYIKYRIKLKSRPYNYEELKDAIIKHKGYVKNKWTTSIHSINYINEFHIKIMGPCIIQIDYIGLSEDYNWADDDSPCCTVE